MLYKCKELLRSGKKFSQNVLKTQKYTDMKKMQMSWTYVIFIYSLAYLKNNKQKIWQCIYN